MGEQTSAENSGEIELYGELGVLPKVGVKVRLARKARVDRVLASAADHAELEPGQLDDRVAGSDDRVRDVVVMTALRAQQVDDDDYLDVLGRLIAGALDTAQIDEIAFITSEITKLEPVHLRALFGYFHFGRQDAENAEPDLSPADAAWAVDWYRPSREIAYLLRVGRDTTARVLLRLEQEMLIQAPPTIVDYADQVRGPSDWAGRVLSILYPALTITFEPRPEQPTAGTERSPTSATVDSTAAQDAPLTQRDRPVKDRRAVDELVKEIKKAEKDGLSPLAHDITGVDGRWLDLMKTRLRRVDPDNPWAHY